MKGTMTRAMRPTVILAALAITLICLGWPQHSLASVDTCQNSGNGNTGECADDERGRPPPPPRGGARPPPNDANDGSFAVGIKTCGHYHATRTRAAYEAWARHVPRRIFASDARNVDDPRVDRDTAVFRDIPRAAPYEPPWARDDYDPDTDTTNPFTLPQLTRRVADLVERLHDRFAPLGTQWFLIVDDDTFVRVPALRRYLARLDPAVPQLLGAPTASDKFATPDSKARLGRSFHCGGGGGVLLSRALMASFRARVAECLSGTPHTTLFWYWDEVELLGRCLYDFERVNCTSAGIGYDGERVVSSASGSGGDGGGDDLMKLLGGGGGGGGGVAGGPEEEALQLAMVSIMLAQQRQGGGGGGNSKLSHAPLPWPPRFAGGFNREEDWANFDAVAREVAGGDFTRFSSLTFHKALPRRMALLAEQFAFDFDEEEDGDDDDDGDELF